MAVYVLTLSCYLVVAAADEVGETRQYVWHRRLPQ
jgi:hypothetical protein